MDRGPGAREQSGQPEYQAPGVAMPSMFNRCWLFAAAAALLPLHASAQDWPSRPIKLIIPFAPGGGTDVIARTMGQRLSQRLGQPVVPENKAGAGGAIGFAEGAKAAPDGYTLTFITGAYTTNAATGKKMSFDPIKDIKPIALVGTTPLLIAVPPNSPVKTLKDLVDMARAKPNTVTYGSGGIGAMSHLGMELLASEARVQFTHIPYKGMAPAFNDMMAGTIQAGLTTFATTNALLQAGKLRGIVVTGPQRTPFAPNLPTTAEAGFPGVNIEFWWGFIGPSGLPSPIVKRLNDEINAILAQPETKELLGREAAVGTPGTPEDFGRLISTDLARWNKLIRDNNIKVE
jgi:tripartite-type tricarboxylate transporter receptor subunit TctC